MTSRLSIAKQTIIWLVLLTAHLLNAIPATAAASPKPPFSSSKQPLALVDTAQAVIESVANKSSAISAGNTASLTADNQINLLASQNTTTASNTSSSNSASIGVAFNIVGKGAGITISAAGSQSKGNGAGQDTTHNNTTVTGSSVNLTSGGDITLRGAVVSGNTVTAIVGGNLTIESPIDTSSYKETGTASGFGISYNITTGAPGASLSGGSTNINSTLSSVGTQSAIRAGDGGFQVNVQGNTTLTGGAITSSQTAINNAANAFTSQGGVTTTDIVNSASFNANQTAVSVGVGPKPNATGGTSTGITGASAGIGSANGNATSVTAGGISGIAGNTAVRTGDAETGIKPIFNLPAVKTDIGAAVVVTQAFGPVATTAWGNYANDRWINATTPEDRACWSPTGPCRAGGHAFIGGLTGGASGAVGGAASSLIAPHLYAALVSSGLPPVTAQALTMLGTGSVGAAFGGSPAALAAVTETGNNWVNFLTNITRLAGQAATSGVNSLNAGGLAALRQCAGLDWCSVLMTTSVIAAVTAPQIAINPPSLADQIPGGYGAGPRPEPSGPLINYPVSVGSGTETSSPITAQPGSGSTGGNQITEPKPGDNVLVTPGTPVQGVGIVMSNGYVISPTDSNASDWRSGLNQAFNQPGMPPRDEFVPTKWAQDVNGKSFPVEWRHPSGAEVNIDTGHVNPNAPSTPHVGWQTGGKRNSGGGSRGHIFVPSVPVHRPTTR